MTSNFPLSWNRLIELCEKILKFCLLLNNNDAECNLVN